MMEVQTTKELTVFEKYIIVANVLLNSNGIQQIRGKVFKNENKMCAFGLLGFRAGIPKKELKKMTCKEGEILLKYGITELDNSKLIVSVPYRTGLFWNKKTDTLGNSIHRLNDKGWSFEQISKFINSKIIELQTTSSESSSP